MTGLVLVVGALHLDVVVEAPHLPALDETVMGRAVDYRFGGKGGNQAAAAARLGARVAMIGRVGSDAAADTLLAALDAAGVERSQVRRGPGASGMSVAIVEAGGGYGAVIVSGANRDIPPAEVAAPEGAELVLIQNEVPEAVNLAAARAARAAGARLVLNAAPARAMAPELLEMVDLLVVNRGEAVALTGSEGLAPDKAARALLARGPRAVIVTLGAGGLVARERTGGFAAQAYRVEVVSTHGAGDAFIGGLAAELARGAGLSEAARFGQAAAALHVSKREAAGPTEAQVRALLGEAG